MLPCKTLPPIQDVHVEVDPEQLPQNTELSQLVQALIGDSLERVAAGQGL